MILGLISDTHGNLPRTRAGLALLTAAGTGHLVHCGDVGGEAVLNLLLEVRESGIPVTAVHGNVDQWDTDLILYAKHLRIPLPGTARFTDGGFSCAVHHGHDRLAMEALQAEADLDFLFTGHTHIPADEREGRLRIINPGAVHRAARPMVSTLNLADGLLVRHEISRE